MYIFWKNSDIELKSILGINFMAIDAMFRLLVNLSTLIPRLEAKS